MRVHLDASANALMTLFVSLIGHKTVGTPFCSPKAKLQAPSISATS